VELSSTGTRLTVGWVRGVQNTQEVRKLVMSGGLENILMVRSCLVPSPLVVAVAANKADLARRRGNMKTRSVLTETLYNLSSSKAITDSLRNFGGGDKDTSFVVCGFGVGLETAREAIRGEWGEVAELAHQVDTSLLTKLHKLSSTEVGDLEACLVARVAAKDAL